MDTEKIIAQHFEQYGSNTWPLQQVHVEVGVYLTIFNTFDNDRVQTVLNWDGKRVTAQYDDAGYCRLISDLFDWASQGYDAGCSSAMHGLFAFTSWAVQDVGRRKKEQMTAQKQNRLKDLEAEKGRVQKELNELLSEED